VFYFMMKTCKRCEQSKPETDYYVHSTTTDKLGGWCKECVGKKNIESYNQKVLAKRGTLLQRDTVELLDGEIWKVLPDPQFENMYEVSNLGRVRSYRSKQKGKRLTKPTNLLGGIWRSNASGYLPYPYMILVNKDGKKIFRKIGVLVLETFVGPRPEKYTMSHLNGKCDDSRLVNLRWESHQDNCDRRGFTGATKHSVNEIKAIVGKRRVKVQLRQPIEHSDHGRLSNGQIEES
jgi:NUMOD4 motif